jgi:hypothetical protein
VHGVVADADDAGREPWPLLAHLTKPRISARHCYQKGKRSEVDGSAVIRPGQAIALNIMVKISFRGFDLNQII